jgi:WD40 repeat protein
LDERLFLVTWDVATGKAVSECQLHPGGVEAFDPENSSIVQRLRETNAAFSPDGKLLLLSWADFRIFEVSSAKEVRRFPNPGLPGMAVFNPGSMVVSPNNQYLLVVTGTKLKEIKGPDGRIEETWESPQLCLWDLSTGRLCRQKALLEAVAGLVAFRPDSRVYAVASWAPDCSFNIISLFDVVSGKELRSFDGLSSRVDSLTFTPDGNRLVTGMNDSSVLLWDVGNK